MRFLLEPPHGAGNLRLGTTRSEVAEVLSHYGNVTAFHRTAEDDPGWLVRSEAISFFAYCDGDGRVDALEFARPADPLADEVIFRGVNLFADPADTVVERLVEAGVHLRVEEGGYSYTVPDLLLSLWRDGGQEGPDGLPLYWESVLVARPGYYG